VGGRGISEQGLLNSLLKFLQQYPVVLRICLLAGVGSGDSQQGGIFLRVLRIECL
jgi:hypothetical protein